MDEKRVDTIVEEEQEKKTSASSASHAAILILLLVVVFAAVATMIYMITKDTETLTSDSQKLIYPLLSGGLVGGMAVIWLYYQTLRNNAMEREPSAAYFPVLTGAITMILALLAYVAIGMWPFGYESAMVVDLHHQYGPMLSELRDMLTNGGSPFYSFEVGTGTSFIPLFAYYLASPLNALLVFFPQAFLPEGILLITVIKMTLTGAFMALAVQYIFRRRDYAAVAIGVMYAFMMFMLAYSWDIMWLDCVMFLPLVVMGFERMMRTGKYLMYVLTLAYTLYANYYIGFMICIFMVLYYVAFFFRAKRTGVKQGVGFMRFAIGSLLGGGLAMFILIPAFLSLSGTSAAGEKLPDLAANFNAFELIGRGLYGVKPTVRSGNLPNTYCGVLAVLALPIFATMDSIPMRRRLAYLGMFGFMALSLVINQLDLMWHGFHTPNDLPYRYSFLYSFALLLIAYEVLYRIKDIKPVQIGVSIFGLGVYLILEDRFGWVGEQADKRETYSFESIYLSFALIVIYGIIMLCVSQRKMIAKAAYALIACIVVVETLFNSGLTLTRLNEQEFYTNHEHYLDNEETQLMQTTVNEMEAIGDAAAKGDFYRLEFAPRKTCTDTALFDYRGITVFASSGSESMTKFMGGQGHKVNGVNSQMYQNFVPTIDSLLGLKYIAFKKTVDNNKKVIEDVNDTNPYLKPKKVVTSTSGEHVYYIYENTAALPVGFVVDSDMRDWNYDEYATIPNQNSLFATMTGNPDNVMPCEKIVGTNAIATMNGDSNTNFTITAGGTAKFETTMSHEGRGYIHVDCRAASKITIFYNNKSSDVQTNEPFIVDAGDFKVGEKVRIEVTTSGSATGAIFVSTLNQDAFDKNIKTLKDNGLKITSFNDSSMEGTVNAKKNGVMMMAVEYDKGWTVKVDGQKVETFPIGNALLGFEMPAGQHTVSLNFIPRGFAVGVTISIISLVALVFVMDYTKRRDTGKGFLPFMSKFAQQKGAEEE